VPLKSSLEQLRHRLQHRYSYLPSRESRQRTARPTSDPNAWLLCAWIQSSNRRIGSLA